MGALSLKSSSGNHYLKDKMMLGLFCISALIVVTAGQGPPPPPPGQVLPPPPPPPSYGFSRPGYPIRPYGRPPMGPFGKLPGGGIDPLTLLAFQGGLGGSGDTDNLLPLLLLVGGGLGGHPGKGGLGGGLGGVDPLTLLAFQKGGLGGSGGNDNLLPLLLLGGGGHPGKKGGLGGLNPLLLSGLLGCKEPDEDCTIPDKADGTLCGVNGPPGTKKCCECKKA